MKIEMTGIGSEFQGVGRAEDGRVAFTPYALPGEEAEVSIHREADRFLECRLEQILSPSPDRIEPMCVVYGQCGGCKAQHVAYPAALELKRQIVEQTIQRIGGLDDVTVRPTIGSSCPWRDRNKGEFAVSTDRKTRTPVIGQCEAGSHRLVPVVDCPIQHELSITAVHTVSRWMLKHGIPAWDADRSGGLRYLVTRVNDQNEMMVILSSTTGRPLPHTGELNEELLAATNGKLRSLYQLSLSPRPSHALDGRARLLFGRSVLRDHLLGLSFDISPQTFFQVNRHMTEALYTEALNAAALTGNETVLDAYCGAGTISLALARKAKQVVGVELNEKAIENAKQNAGRNGLADRTRFIAGDAAREALRLFEEGLRPDVIVVDPPRKGVEAKLLDAMVRCEPKRIVYVSCNPSTLARDLKILLADGGYTLEYVQPVDMFSHTEHVESVALLIRK